MDMDIDKIIAKFDLIDTFLEELLVMLELDEFIDTVAEIPPRPGEEIVGKLSKLEKALGNLIYQYVITERELVGRAHDQDQDKPVSAKEMKEINVRLAIIRSYHKIATDWRRSSISLRFSNKIKTNTISVETRSQFRVVLVSRKKPKSECIIDLLGEVALAGLCKGNVKN